MIRTIGDETNVVGLNAAIAAGRGGDEGKGFVVVGSEVGKVGEG
ncbi:methyl-accepting chemotaxis protein [Priestia megaterium]|nr:methyl-accepting chemotaxis protein [Priestia megaterium]